MSETRKQPNIVKRSIRKTPPYRKLALHRLDRDVERPFLGVLSDIPEVERSRPIDLNNVIRLKAILKSLDKLVIDSARRIRYTKPNEPPETYHFATEDVKSLDREIIWKFLSASDHLKEDQASALKDIDLWASRLIDGDSNAFEYGYVWFLHAKRQAGEIPKRHPLSGILMKNLGFQMVQDEKVIGDLEIFGLTNCADLCLVSEPIVKAAVITRQRWNEDVGVADLTNNIRLFNAGIGLAFNHYQQAETLQIADH